MRLLLMGLIMGFVSGILSAPTTGKATRARLRDKAMKYSNESAGFVDRKSRHIRNIVEGYRHRARQMAEDLRRGVSDVNRQIKQTDEPSVTVESDIARSA